MIFRQGAQNDVAFEVQQPLASIRIDRNDGIKRVLERQSPLIGEQAGKLRVREPFQPVIDQLGAVERRDDSRMRGFGGFIAKNMF